MLSKNTLYMYYVVQWGKTPLITLYRVQCLLASPSTKLLVFKSLWLFPLLYLIVLSLLFTLRAMDSNKLERPSKGLLQSNDLYQVQTLYIYICIFTRLWVFNLVSLIFIPVHIGDKCVSTRSGASQGAQKDYFKPPHVMTQPIICCLNCYLYVLCWV